jgi:hypothetical protein
MFPIPKHDQKMMGYFRELIETGEFKPVIDRTYPLDRIVERTGTSRPGRGSAMWSSPSIIPPSD